MNKVSSVAAVNRASSIERESLEQTELFINRGLAEFGGSIDPEGCMLYCLEGLLGELEFPDFTEHLKTKDLSLAISRILVEDARKRHSKRSEKDLERTPAMEVLERANRQGVTKSTEYDVIHSLAVVYLTLPKKRTRDYNLVRNTLLKIFQEGIDKQNLSKSV